MGAYALEKLHLLKEKHSVIGDIRGLGLMIELKLLIRIREKEMETLYSRFWT